MAIRASIAQVKHIKPGKYIYRYVYCEGGKDIIARALVVSMEPKYGDCKVTVKYDNHKVYESEREFFLGDDGVRPQNYDNRVAQVFMTRKAAEKAVKAWAGRWPNFLHGNKQGHSVRLKEVHRLHDLWDTEYPSESEYLNFD